MAAADGHNAGPARQERASFVYFIQDGDDSPVKIGVAADPEQRRRELQTGNYRRLAIRLVIPGDSALEAELHRRFKDWHVEGEWFGGGERSKAILTFGEGLDEHRVEIADFRGDTVEYIGNARRAITSKERLDLRHDIERLWLKHFNASDIAAELDFFWGLSEDEIRREIKEMKKSSVWNFKRHRIAKGGVTRGAAI
jgi:hypothetical protein